MFIWLQRYTFLLSQGDTCEHVQAATRATVQKQEKLRDGANSFGMHGSPKQTLRVIDGISIIICPGCAYDVWWGGVSLSPRSGPTPVPVITYRLHFTKCVGGLHLCCTVCFLAPVIVSHHMKSTSLNCQSVCQPFGQVPKVAACRFQSLRASPVFDMLHQKPRSQLCIHGPGFGTKIVLPSLCEGLPQG